ncbi:MAG: hypothetical protein ABII64_02455 [Elusimicrobiota bacterium]
MKEFKAAAKKYEERMYYYMMEELCSFEERIKPLSRETGLLFLNKIVDLAMKIGFYVPVATMYKQNRDDKFLIGVTEFIINEYVTKMPIGYDPKESLPPLWIRAESKLGKNSQDEIKRKIDEFINDLGLRTSNIFMDFVKKYEYNETRSKVMEKVHDFIQQALIVQYTERAAKADGVKKQDLSKYIKENIFWKGRAAEIVAEIKLAVLSNKL